MPRPALKYNDLIEQLHSLSKHPNDLLLKRIEREANNLLQQNAQHAYTILGIIAAIKGNSEASSGYHEKSLALGKDPTTYENYAFSLAYNGYWWEAIEQADNALALIESPSTLMLAIDLAARAGQPAKAKQYHHRLVKIIPEAKQNTELGEFMQHTDLLAKTGLTDAQISEVHALAEQVAHEFNTRIHASVAWEDHWSDTETPEIVNELYVDPKLWLPMHNRLIQLLVQHRPFADQSGRYCLMFLSYRKPHEHNPD